MDTAIHIKRMQIFAQILYEINVIGKFSFEERYFSTLENTLDVDLPQILKLCMNHPEINLADLTEITIQYTLYNVEKKYVLKYKPIFKDVFTVYVNLNKTDKKYVFPFDDPSKKEDMVIETFFNEWNKAIKELQEKTLNSKNTIDISDDIINFEKLSVDKELLENNKIKTILIGIIKDGNNYKIVVSWKGLRYSFGFDNDEVKKYPLNLTYFLRKIPYDPYFLKGKNIIVLAGHSIRFVLDRNSKTKQFIIIIGNTSIGVVKFNTNDISSQIQAALADYPEILNHLSNWRNTFANIDQYLSSDVNAITRNPLDKNTTFNSSKQFASRSLPLTITNMGHSIKFKWNKIEGATAYYIYRKIKNTKPQLLSMTQNPYYYEINSKTSKKAQYAVYAVYDTSQIDNLIFDEKDFHSANGNKEVNENKRSIANKPQIKPIQSIRVGDVYYNKSATPCGHHFWKVTEVYSDAVLIKCTQCKMLQNTPITELKRNYSFSYYNPSENGSIKQHSITAADVIVLSSSKRCTAQNHKVENYIGLLPVTTKFGCNKIEVNVSYCKDCNRFTMLKSDYLRIAGTPVCEVRDLTTNRIINHSTVDFFNETNEHKLHRLGYNVRFGNGMSNFDRQQLLARIINNHELSRGEIISHIEYCININANKSNMDSAVRKWKTDLEFLRSFKSNAEKVAIGSITLKYNKAKHR